MFLFFEITKELKTASEGGRRGGMGEIMFLRIFRTEGKKYRNNIDIFAGHANRAITGGGNVPGILAEESNYNSITNIKLFKRWAVSPK